MLAFEESFFLKTPFKILGLACNIWLVSIDGQICVPFFKIFIHFIKPTVSWDLMKFWGFKNGGHKGDLFCYHFQSWKKKINRSSTIFGFENLEIFFFFFFFFRIPQAVFEIGIFFPQGLGFFLFEKKVCKTLLLKFHFLNDTNPEL